MMVTLPMWNPPEKRRSRGMSAICSGTTCSAKMMKKRTSLPLKRVRASAYAAMAASVTGMIVAGIVMASELIR